MGPRRRRRGAPRGAVVGFATGLVVLVLFACRAAAVTGSAPAPTAAGGPALTAPSAATTAPSVTVSARVPESSSAAALMIRIELTTSVDGTGTLVVTTDVAARVRSLVGALRLDDLRGTRWTTVATAQGFRASTAFSNPGEATQALLDLGPPFALRLERRRSFLTISNRLSGRVDLRAGWAALSDDLVRQKLGSPLGIDVDELAASLGARPETVVAITVRAEVAGRIRSIPTPFGATTAFDITVRHTRTDVVWPLAIALVAALVIVVRGFARARRPRSRSRGGHADGGYDDGEYDEGPYDDGYDDERPYEPSSEEEADRDFRHDERAHGRGRGRGGRR